MFVVFLSCHENSAKKGIREIFYALTLKYSSKLDIISLTYSYLRKVLQSRKMEQNNLKGFYHNAMRCGTYLGIVWAIMYILLFKSYTSQLFSMVAMALLMASPFIACRLVVGYRKSECGDRMEFPQAWAFLTCMYICATLFSTLTNYIFFNLIDQGALLMEMNDILSQIIVTPGIAVEEKAGLESLQDELSQLTSTDLVWQLLSNNIFSSVIMPPVIATFARKNQQ
jgi:hypothetical protein